MEKKWFKTWLKHVKLHFFLRPERLEELPELAG
jgi:hypothetical protein